MGRVTEDVLALLLERQGWRKAELDASLLDVPSWGIFWKMCNSLWVLSHSRRRKM